jgi:hypothetical protein
VKGIHIGATVCAVALTMLAVSAASASADTVQLDRTCQVTTNLQGGRCSVRLACPDKVTTNAGRQPVLGCVASGEVRAAGELTGLLHGRVLAQPKFGGVTKGPRVKASCAGNVSNCRARTDGQNIGNGGPTGASDVERAVCSTKRSIGVIMVTTACHVYINAVTAP